jgi:predicted ABC-type transport system involved in lysophospholipase L1 biosynthesis ATPase subunit
MSGPDSHPILHAEGLVKSYRSGSREIHVLKGVNLSLQRGETLSIRGESGSGKSTLLNLLAGIESPDQGAVHWNGTCLSGIPESRRPRQRSTYLGFVFQSFYLVPELNALENVVLAARIAGKPAREAVELARHLMEELGLAERLESSPAQLSGGERQRTAIARALVNKPSVLLADEPTGNLDERTAERVMDQLLQAVERHGAGLVLVTHHPGFAGRTQSQFHLEDGHLV